VSAGAGQGTSIVAIGEKNHYPLDGFLATQRARNPGPKAGLDWRALGRRVQAERVRQGLSEQELARRVAVRRAFVVQLEQGERMPSFDLLQRIAAALGLRLKVDLEADSSPAES
jgi:ribosome-binding protein aMBF1 (putative translation factor)